jgi:nucleotide-binding universal stress UspA family protein
MLRSILVGLDDSRCSGVAVELGIHWAQRLEAVLIGLAIMDQPSIRRREPVPLGGRSYHQERVAWVLDEIRRRVEHALDQFAERCTAAGVRYHSLKDSGAAYQKILQASRRYDLVLLGQETHFEFWAEQQPDQTLQTVLHHTTRPVVTVPASLPTGQGVLVTYDGRRESDLALQAFEASGLDFGEDVHVLSLDRDLERASGWAQRAMEFLQSHHIQASALPAQGRSSIASTILDHVEQRPPRLLVMGAYGRSALREFLAGSVTDAVVRGSPVPVLLCH